MVDTTIPFQVVIFTQYHSISGGLFLREQRLSDFLNDRRDTTIMLRNASVARLAEPAKILERTSFSVIPKTGIVLAFEPPQKTAPPPRRFVKYPKEKYEVFLALDTLEVRGEVNVQGPLDLRHIITNVAQSFLPITQATVTIKENPAMVLKREAVLVNLQFIRFMGDMEPKSPTQPLP
jgi:hypothetical protein